MQHTTAPRVSIRRELTVNLGNYQNYKLQLGLDADVPEGITYNDHYTKLSKVTDSWLKKEYEEIKKLKGGQTQ